jgi:hypothetical protein
LTGGFEIDLYSVVPGQKYFMGLLAWSLSSNFQKRGKPLSWQRLGIAVCLLMMFTTCSRRAKQDQLVVQSTHLVAFKGTFGGFDDMR